MTPRRTLHPHPSTQLLDRRDFLGCTLAGTAGLLALPVRSRAGAFTGKIRKAVKFHMVAGKETIEDKFRLLKDLGFDGTEIRTQEGADGRWKQFLKASEKTGVRVHGVVNSSNPDIRTPVEMARALGGDSVLVVARYATTEPYWKSYREAWDVIQAGLVHAERHQVKLLVENVWASFLISPLDMQRFVDSFRSPWVGAYFDVGNNVRWGVPEHWVQVLGRQIVKLDIKEYSTQLQNNKGLREGFKVPLGEGSIRWDAVRRELQNLGYQGWATAELPAGDRVYLEDVARRMNQVLDL